MKREELNPRFEWDFEVPFRVSQHEITFVTSGRVAFYKSLLYATPLLIFAIPWSTKMMVYPLSITLNYWHWLDTLFCVAVGIIVLVLVRGIALSRCTTECVLDARDPSKGTMSIGKPWSKDRRVFGCGPATLTSAEVILVGKGVRCAKGLALRCGDGVMLIACGVDFRVEEYRNRLPLSVAALPSNSKDVAISISG